MRTAVYPGSFDPTGKSDCGCANIPSISSNCKEGRPVMEGIGAILRWTLGDSGVPAR